MDLSTSTAIVTGASRGIGRAIATALAEQGCRVAMVARSQELLEELHQQFNQRGYQSLPIVADITDDDAIERIVRATLDWCGQIDILVNNAGIGIFKPAVDLTPEEFDAMWLVNVRAPVVLTHAVLPTMIAQQRGAIVNIASLAGKNSFVGGTGYAATKWALRGWASCLMLEVRQHNIRVITICPGSVDTNFSHTNKRGEHITQPEDVAAAVVFALTAPDRTMFSEIDLRPTKP
ncbi:MAG: SDR family NAD(P)-dependent oxidoreductase [Bacteroidota bacterium]|nr:SDR family NAD(P)-dependent oxidoreductase [Bacteroidota bacterium]